jgi:hypothetical protein
MKTAMDIKELHEQASRLKQEQPEFYAFLAERDALLVQALLHVASRIPEPDELPHIPHLFADLFTTESCANRWFQPQAIQRELAIEIPDSMLRMQKRAEWLCTNGIRLQKTSLRELAGG